MLQFLLTISDESYHSKIEYIYIRYHEDMLRFAISKFQSMGRNNYLYDAEDAVQNVFIKIVKYIDKLDLSRSETEIKNYCFSILSNEICCILGDNEICCEDISDLSIETEFDFLSEINLKEKYDDVVKAIELLDDRYSSTLYLIFCRELTVNEIAEMMGISTQTVYSRIRRGKIALVNTLKGTKTDASR